MSTTTTLTVGGKEFVVRQVWVPADLDAELQRLVRGTETPGAVLVRLARQAVGEQGYQS